MSELAWHFLRFRDGVPTLRDGRVAPALGEWLEHEGPVIPCQSGLHASRRVIDALEFVDWEGAVACLVEVDGTIREHEGNKIACSRRRIVAMVDADDVLRTFAREQALLVIHLWDAPPVVREYLETGDESKRAAARDAAWDAAWAAARDAAWDAAWAAARDAAWAAARDAARDAAWAAARDAAWAAAWAAARAAARDAASDLLETMFLSDESIEWAPGEGP